jgi:predicted TIM-barrel fold metal-dependent hydrolase
MAIQSFISADSHVVEPPDLWTTRMEQRFRARAPRIERTAAGDHWVAEGLNSLPIGLFGPMVSEKAQGGIDDRGQERRYEDTRPGANNPEARLVDQRLDHVEAEVIFPGFCLTLFGIPDPEYQRDCIRVYNDWLAEFCGGEPRRLIGNAMLPMRGPVDWAIAEAQRCAKMGLRGLMIPATKRKPSYHEPVYDKLWAALDELNLPIGVHSGADDEPLAIETGIPLQAQVCENKMFMMQRSLALLLTTAIPQRFPKLRFVIVEGGIGWIAAQLRFMDHWWEDHHRWMQPKLEEPPSFYFKRNFWATFEDDRPGILTRHLLGVDRLMWDRTIHIPKARFPSRWNAFARISSDVAEDETRMMVHGNVAALYGIS